MQADKFDEMARECVSDWYVQTPVYLERHQQRHLADEVAALVRREVEAAFEEAAARLLDNAPPSSWAVRRAVADELRAIAAQERAAGAQGGAA